MLLCDAHVHIWVDNPPLPRYVARTGFSATAEALLAMMDAQGVERAAVITPRAMGWDNTVTLEAARGNSGRITPIALVNYNGEDPAGELRQHVANGAAGARISPFNELPPCETRLAEPRLWPFWALAEERCMPIHLHIGAQQLVQVAGVAEQFPGVPLVIDHLGRPDVAAGPTSPGFRTFLELARYPRVYAKAPSSGFFSRCEPPFLDLIPFIRAAVAAYGSHRLLWGSDWPGCLAYGHYADATEPWYSCCDFLNDLDRERIFAHNFNRLYRCSTEAAQP